METMQITITKSVSEVKEIRLPLFRKNCCHAYKVFSKDKCLQVCYGRNVDPSITVAHAGLAWNDSENVDIDESAFNNIHAETSARIVKEAGVYEGSENQLNAVAL
jgi:hypothetical protein